MWDLPSNPNQDLDIQLALAAIAAEFGIDVAEMPGAIEGILRSFSAAHYSDGVRDAKSAVRSDSLLPSSSDITPVVGPWGRRRRSIPYSKRPTPLIPPSHDDE